MKLATKTTKRGTVILKLQNAPCSCGSYRPTDAFGERGKCDECGRPLVVVSLKEAK